MCGICGFVNQDDRVLLNKMTRILKHRGPDDSGDFLDDNVGLGHRRLSIIDVAGGHQPIHNEDGSIWVVFNGEIYNYQELKGRMDEKGHRFYTNSDTETIVHLYEEYGDYFLSELRGMFAIALWDTNAKRLLIARDRLGKKPLYYAQIEDEFYFSSEIKSILESPEIKREADPSSVYQLIAYRFVTDNKTMFKDIFKLLPGEMGVFEGGTLSRKLYWDLKMKPDYSQSEKDLTKKFLNLLKESVSLRLISEVPLGAYLSGGLDSSVIVGLMSQLKDEPVKTFTVGFTEGNDEREYARLVSEEFGTDHTEYAVDFHDMTKIIPEVIWHLDEPLGDPAVFPSYLISREVKKKVTVALLGEGSDELLAGYKEYKILSQTYRFVPLSLRKKFFNSFRAPITKNETDSLFSDNMPVKQKEFNRFESGPEDPLNQSLLFDIKHVLPNFQLMRVDKITMANSLEARAPFLDHRLAEFAARLPPSMKLSGFTDKYILRQAVKDFVPEEILKRKKQPFITPLPSWFEEDLVDMAYDHLTSQRFKERGYFKTDYVTSLFDKRKKAIRKGKYNYQIWILLMLETWHRIFIDEESDHARKP